MIVHIVFFKFKEEQKKENIKKAKDMLLSLPKTIPTLKSIEVGLNFANEDRAMDLSIITHFESNEDLKIYAIHPEHLKVVDFIKQVVEYSKVVDYETN
ncbi:MAG: Dabb family protein [Sulfurovaceae bacterium]|nr:Dabb family protein [Sulfurovaceae bacterium]MDD5548081.1 Dabb family protein [Sulfurovaceae bacterium]